MRIMQLYDTGSAIPDYASAGAAGLDLRAAGHGILAPGRVRAWPTGIAVAIPDGHEGQVRGRSGLAAKHGIFVHVGTVDSDFRGEIKVIMINLGDQPFAIANGDRIAQLVVAPVARPVLEEVAALDATARGSAGLGSTGIA